MMNYPGANTTPSGSAAKSLVYGCFWVLVTIVFLYDTRYLIDKASLPFFILSGSFRVILLIIVGWINANRLVPQLLLKKRYWIYGISVLLLILAYLFIQGSYDYWMYGFIIGGYRFDFVRSLLYNFSHTSLYLVLMVALKFSIDWYEQRKTLQEVQLQQLHAEINFLRSQVNPHFLFNALNNLYALTLRKSEKAPGIVLKLSEMMEYMLYESSEELVPLRKELRYLQNFIGLEQLRQEEPVPIQLNITGTADPCMIPPFVLLTLVENAFKHGIHRSADNSFLVIDIDITDNLVCVVENSKPAGTSHVRTGGIGLANLEKRLSLLYPGAYSLQTEDKPDRYSVRLQINNIC